MSQTTIPCGEIGLKLLADLVAMECEHNFRCSVSVRMKGALMTMVRLSDAGLIQNVNPRGDSWGIISTELGRKAIDERAGELPEYRGTIARINS